MHAIYPEWMSISVKLSHKKYQCQEKFLLNIRKSMPFYVDVSTADAHRTIVPTAIELQKILKTDLVRY